MFVENSANDNVILKRNNNYHGLDSLGNQLPFLDSIVISFLPTKKQELDNFQNGDLAIMNPLLPPAIEIRKAEGQLLFLG